jgi:cyanophycin synthetase
MLKRYTKNIEFDLYLNAADKLGIRFVSPFEQGEQAGYFLIGHRRLYIDKNKLGVNSAISCLIARNKYRTYCLLKGSRLPCPKAVLLNGEDRPADVVRRTRHLKKPLVIKPVRGSSGKGVSVRIESEEGIASAIRFARKMHDAVLVEEYIAGTNYRVNVFDGEVIDIVERIPAYVVGDGQSSLAQLIDAKNAHRLKLGLKPIRVDQELRRYLHEQHLDMTRVPSLAKRVFLRQNCNMDSGGEARRVDMKKEVHPDNLRMFVRAADVLGLVLAGVDFITPDISKSYRNVRCAINEINRAPMLGLHYFCDFAMSNMVGEKIFARLKGKNI